MKNNQEDIRDLPRLTLHDIQKAHKRIQGRIVATPIISVGRTMTPHGNPIALKAENIQPGGSFKIRGALYAMAQLTDLQRSRGVVAYSTGNHAQAVALAAAQQGICATIVMSHDTPINKVNATKRWGAIVVLTEASSAARRSLAEQLAQEEQLTLIPPYDDLHVIAGQGTIGLELLEHQNVGSLFVPIGGGGLIAGIAAAVKQKRQDIRIIGVEPEWENDAWLSYQKGERVSLTEASASIADAIKVQTLGDLTYPLIRTYVDDIVTVSESEIAQAVVLAIEEAHLVLEPSGAIALAAAKKYQGTLPEGLAVSIASGGNIMMETLLQITEQISEGR